MGVVDGLLSCEMKKKVPKKRRLLLKENKIIYKNAFQ